MINFFFLLLLINQGEFSISPLYFEIKAPAGARRKVTITVINETYTERVKILVERADVIETPEGVYQPVEIGKGAPSCANWLKFKDSIIELAPQLGKEIDVFIEIPGGVKGGRYGALTFTTQPAKEEMKYRTKIPVYFEITIQPEIKPKVSIQDIKIVEDIKKLPRFMFYELKDAIAVLVSVKNEGDIHAVVRGNLILRNKKGKKLREIPLGGGRGIILPNTTVEIASIIKRLEPGEYIIDAIVRYGTLTPAKATATFTIEKKRIEKKEMLLGGTILLNVKPEFIEMPIPPGAFRIKTILLENEEDSEVKVNAEIKEMVNDLEGELYLSDTFGYQYSAINFVQLEEKEFVLKPKERKVIKLKFNIPKEEISGGRYAFLILSISKEGVSLPVSYQIPIFINFLGKANEEIRIEKIEVTGKAPANFYIYLENTGDIHLKPTGVISISQKLVTGAGEQVMKIGEHELKELKGYLLPKGKVKMFAEGPLRLKSGKYFVKAIIKYGKNKELIFERELNL
ncbi:MAG: DUF916 domain-containing protein [candidate division WOR-3 bacterium]|nr:DUF916 domain-containing protein [candidate division WOR-3 bacterium]